eukprot:GFUD01007778.1.p1 GENE.GFUD01007778.1~~GFUD01007778.1.p1  ORF type:complete len:356 (-),score=97.92 GFUD01007778.1:35-1102(-)
MFMEAFATGFSMSSDTKPGFCIENENYKIGLEGVLCDQTKNIVSRGFENCYSWREVMELILDATEEAAADNLIDIEEAAEDAMREWLVTFKGWGLLSSILDSKIHRHVVLSLAYTSSNWDMDTGGEFTEEKVFDTVKYVYDNIPGKELHSLVPKFGIWFEEIVEGGENEERKKNFTLFFNAKWALEVKFVIEKKRVNNSLLDLAAEAAVKDIMIEEDIDELDIPETLFEVVRDKFCDAEWVRSFWSAKLEVDKEKEGSDVAGGNLDKDDGEVHQLNVDNIGVDDEVHNEEFLASVIDELSSDVEHVLDGDLEPDFHEDVSNNVEQEVKNIHGIDGLLSIWVFIFMILGIVAYIWC